MAKIKEKKKEHLDPLKLITVGITPPWLAENTQACRLDKSLIQKGGRPKPLELSRIPWLSQEKSYQAGYHLLTHGLRKHASHQEIEICNVPGWFVPTAQRLLNVIADYVLNYDRLKHGETMLVRKEYPEALIGFREVSPHESGTANDLPVLRVVFLR